jgi:KaiC/GvpD/RAD55 family RecA-like ATPase
LKDNSTFQSFDIVDLAKTQNSQINLVLFRKEEYQQQRIVLARKLSNMFKSTCYVTINKPYHKVLDEFKRYNIEGDKFFFLDASPREDERQSSDGAITIGSPSDVTSIGIELGRLLHENRFEACLIDSIDTLGLYLDWNVVLRFLHSVVSKFRMGDNLLFLLTSQGDPGLSKEIFMLVDGVLEL